MVVIEFLGLPGAGKTTLGKTLSKELSECSIKHAFHNYGEYPGFIPFNSRRLYGLIWTLCNSPLFFLLANKFIWKSNQKSFRDYLSVTLNFFQKYHDQIKYSNDHGNIHILDEGVLHAIWSIIYSSENESIIDCLDNSLLEALNISDIYIYFHIEPALSIKRIFERGKDDGRVHRSMKDYGLENQNSLIQLFNKYKCLYKIVLNYDSEIVEVEWDTENEVSLELIKDAINSYLK